MNAENTDLRSSKERPVHSFSGFIFAAVLLALTVLVTTSDTRSTLRGALEWIMQLGGWGQVFFVLIYAAATVLLIPGTILGLGAGAMFGVLHGSLLVSLGSTLGATCAFLLGRYLARDWVAGKIAKRTSFAAIDQAVAREGWKIVLLTRLSPVFPFTLLNYAFGLTPVSLRDYVVASWIGMLPGTVMFVYLGSLARAGVEPQAHTTGEWILHGLGLLATVTVTVFVTRLARRALAARINH